MRQVGRALRRIMTNSYLTDRHRWPSRYGLAGAGFAATLLVTASPRLARDMFRNLARDRFTTGLRRLSWYLRHGWPGLNLSSDPLYLFCEGMDRLDLAAIRHFLRRNAARQTRGAHLAELSFISACDMLAAFGGPDYAAALATFHEDAGAALREAVALRGGMPPAGPEGGAAGNGSSAQGSVVRQEFSRAAAEEALRDVMDLLHGHGYRPFILSGTLLGSFREGRILDHDYDIDLGLFADQVDDAALERLLRDSPPFRCIAAEQQMVFAGPVRAVTGLRRLPVLFKLRHPTGIISDIFLHYREGDQAWHGSTLFRWTNADFGLSDRSLAGTLVAGPDDPARHLTENYGDWQVPRRDFHCATDTPNMVHFPGALSLVLAIWRLRMLAARPAEEFDLVLEEMRRTGLAEPDGAGGWRLVPGLFAPA